MTKAMILILTLLISVLGWQRSACAPSYGVYISQLIRFARVSSHLADFNACNKTLTAKFSNRGIGSIDLGKFFFLSENSGLPTFFS